MIVIPPPGTWRRVFWLFSGALVSLWLSACAQLPTELAVEDNTAKQFTPDPEHGTIYLFRKSFLSFIGSTAETVGQVSFPIHFDGRSIGTLKAWEYLRLAALPGPHDITVVNSASRRHARLTLEVEKGKLYFIEIIPQAPLDSYPVRLTSVDEKRGKRAVLGGTVVIVEKQPRLFQ